MPTNPLQPFREVRDAAERLVSTGPNHTVTSPPRAAGWRPPNASQADEYTRGSNSLTIHKHRVALSANVRNTTLGALAEKGAPHRKINLHSRPNAFNWVTPEDKIWLAGELDRGDKVEVTLNGVTANKLHAMTAMISSWQVQGATTAEIAEWVATDVNKIVVDFNKNPGINTSPFTKQPVVSVWNLNFVAKVVASTAIAVRGYEFCDLQNYHNAVETTQRFVATYLRRQIQAKGLGTAHSPITRKDLTDECTAIAQAIADASNADIQTLVANGVLPLPAAGQALGFAGAMLPGAARLTESEIYLRTSLNNAWMTLVVAKPLELGARIGVGVVTHGISLVADAVTGGIMEVGIAKVCEAIGKGVAKLTFPEREPEETADYEKAIANVQAKARTLKAHARRDPDKLDQADMLSQYADEYSKAWEYAGKLSEVGNAETKLRNKKAKDAGEPSGFFKRHFGKKKDG